MSSVYNIHRTDICEQLVQINLKAISDFQIWVTPVKATLPKDCAYHVSLHLDGNFIEKKWIVNELETVKFEEYHRNNFIYKFAFSETKIGFTVSEDIIDEEILNKMGIEIFIEKNIFLRSEGRREEPESNYGTLSTLNTLKTAKIDDKSSKYVGFKVAVTNPTPFKDPNQGRPRTVKIWDAIPSSKFSWKIHLCNIINMFNRCRDMRLEWELANHSFYDYEEEYSVNDEDEEVIDLDPDSDEEPKFKKIKKETRLFEEWTPREVSNWIKTLEINNKEVANSFEKNQVVGALLPKLDYGDLSEMGVESFEDRLKIVNAIKNLEK